MKNEQRVAMLDPWSIMIQMSCGGDYLAIQGNVWDHPNFRNQELVSPGTFVSFDTETMIGISISGRHWMLGEFYSNGNARTLEDAITFIKEHWVKK